MATPPKQGKYSYCCGQCGQACEAEMYQQPIQKEQGILQQLHHQNNELIQHIKYLSKRNDQLNQVIQSRLRTEESSLQKQKSRGKSTSGIIYRRIIHEGSENQDKKSFYLKPQPVPSTSMPKESIKQMKDSHKIIKISHFPIDKDYGKRSTDITPPKKTVFAFEEQSNQKNSLQKVYRKQEQYYDRTADKTPPKQLNYLPIYEYKKQQYKQPQENSKYLYMQNSKQAILKGNYAPNPPNHYDVTFRRQADQNVKVNNYNGNYGLKKSEKRTNEPYLAMLDQSEVCPSVYYPMVPQSGLDIYYDRICSSGYPIQDRHRKLYLEY